MIIMANEERRNFLSTLKLMKENELIGLVEALNIQDPRKLKEVIINEISFNERLSQIKSLTVDQFMKESEERNRYPGMRRLMDFVPLAGRKTPEEIRPSILMRIVELKRLLVEVEEVFGLK
jgi:hypothetical protein